MVIRWFVMISSISVVIRIMCFRVSIDVAATIVSGDIIRW